MRAFVKRRHRIQKNEQQLMLLWKGWRRLKVRRSEYVVYGRGGIRRIEAMDGCLVRGGQGLKLSSYRWNENDG